MDILLEDREVAVLDRRRRGDTYKAISEDFGLSPERIRQLHMRTLKKLRTVRELETKYPEFIKAADELDMDYIALARIFSIYKKTYGKLPRHWYTLDDDDILLVRGFGERAVEFFRIARSKRPIVKPQVDGLF